MSSWVTGAKNNGGGKGSVFQVEKRGKQRGVMNERGRGARMMPYLWILRYWLSQSLASRKVIYVMWLRPQRAKRRDGRPASQEVKGGKRRRGLWDAEW
jgi:hypothetical protein